MPFCLSRLPGVFGAAPTPFYQKADNESGEIVRSHNLSRLLDELGLSIGRLLQKR